MALQVGTVYQKMEMRDSGFRSKLSGIKNKVGGLSGLLKTGLVGAAGAAGAALAGMAIQGTRNMKKLEDATRRFRSETGASAKEAKEFRDTVQSLHKQNTDSYEELADTVTAIKQRFDDAYEGMEQDILDYAKVTEQSGVQATEDLHSVMEAWGKDAEDMTEIMDKLKSIQAETGMNAQTMQKALQDTAPAMKALNMNMDDGIAIMGQFAERGVNATKAQRGFRQMMQRLADPTKQQAESLKQLGIQVKETEDGFEVGENALQKFMKRLDKGDLSAEEMAASMDILGRRSGEKIVQAMKNGEAGIKELMETLNNSKGAVKEASEQYDKQLGERWTLIKRKYLHPFMETLGTGLIGVLEDLLSFAENVGPKIQSSFEFLGQLGGDIKETINALSSGDISAIPEIWESSMNRIKSSVSNLWPKLRQSFTEGLQGLRAKVKEIMNGIWEAFKQSFPDFASVIEPHISGIKESFSGLTDAVSSIVDAFSGLTKGEGSPVNRIKALRDIVENVLEYILQNVETAIDTITGVIQIGEGVFTGDWETALEGIKTIFNSWKDWFKQAAESAIGTITGILKLAGVEKTPDQLWQEMLNAIKTKLNEWKGNIIEKITGFKERVVELFTNMGTAIKEAIMAPLNKIREKVKNWTGKVGGFFSNMKEKVVGGSIVPDMMTLIEEEFTGMIDQTTSDTQSFTGTIKSEFQGLRTELKSKVRDTMNTVKDSFTSNLQSVLEGTKDWKTAISDVWDKTLNTITSKAMDFVTNSVWDSVSNIGSSLISSLTGGGGGGGLLSTIGSAIGGGGGGGGLLSSLGGLVSGGGGAGGLLSTIGGSIPVVGGALLGGQALSSMFGSGNMLKDAGNIIGSVGDFLGFGGGDESEAQKQTRQAELETASTGQVSESTLQLVNINKNILKTVTRIAQLAEQNKSIEIDGREVAKAIEQPLAKRLRTKTGVNY